MFNIINECFYVAIYLNVCPSIVLMDDDNDAKISELPRNNVRSDYKKTINHTQNVCVITYLPTFYKFFNKTVINRL